MCQETNIIIIIHKRKLPRRPRFDIIWIMLLLALAAGRCGRVQAFAPSLLQDPARKTAMLPRRRRVTSQRFTDPYDDNQRLDYEHGFHAGNFADVFKHSILVLVMQKMLQKNKPMTYVETHAGAGLYQYPIIEKGTDANREEEAQVAQEFQRGIGGLLPQQPNEESSATPAAVSAYLDIVQSVQGEPGNRDGDAATLIYPGSPLFAASLLQQHIADGSHGGATKIPQHSLLLYEKAESQYQQLKTLVETKQINKDLSVTIHCDNGYTGLTHYIQTTRNPSGRALIMIDPPYQYGSDTDQIVALCEQLQQHWCAARIFIWHPVRRDDDSQERMNRLYRGVRDVIPKSLDILAVEVYSPALVLSNSDDNRKEDVGTGLILIQPPFGIQDDCEVILPRIYHEIQRGRGASSFKEDATNNNLQDDDPIYMQWL